MDLRTANVTRYILPLREGGSLPALAEICRKIQRSRARNQSPYR